MRELGRFGRHVLFFEEPDIVVMYADGEMGLEDLRAIIEATRQASVGRPYILGLIDMSKATTMRPEARKATAELAKDLPYRGIAYFGASFQVRVLINLIMSAASLFSKQSYPSEVFKTEAEARAWLATRRAQLARELEPG